MHERITALNDQTAVAVLTAFVQGLGTPQPAVSALTPETREALRVTVPGVVQPTAHVTDGELARMALSVLWEESENRRPLEQLVDASELETLGLPETIGLATAVLVVLQTHARFERDKNGKFHLLIEKHPTRASLIQPLIQKLLAWSAVGPSNQL
jgi:hypothetical protein